MTSRCRRTSKVSYPSKGRAERALSKLRSVRMAHSDEMIVVPCDYRGRHWHIATNSDLLLDQPDEDAPWDTTQWDQATMQLWARCRDKCEACGRPLQASMVRHHRQRRAVGGDHLWNLVALHDACHRDVHAHPEASRARGLIVSSYEEDPASVPLTLTDGRRVLLTDEGKYEHAA